MPWELCDAFGGMNSQRFYIGESGAWIPAVLYRGMWDKRERQTKYILNNVSGPFGRRKRTAPAWQASNGCTNHRSGGTCCPSALWGLVRTECCGDSDLSCLDWFPHSGQCLDVYWITISCLVEPITILFTRPPSMSCSPSIGPTPNKARDVYLMLALCWASVVDDGPALSQHWVIVSYLLGRHIQSLWV